MQLNRLYLYHLHWHLYLINTRLYLPFTTDILITFLYLHAAIKGVSKFLKEKLTLSPSSINV